MNRYISIKMNEEVKAIQWMGHNRIETIQFGMTSEGKKIKINCANNVEIIGANGCKLRARFGDYIILYDGSFYVSTKESFGELFKLKGGESMNCVCDRQANGLDHFDTNDMPTKGLSYGDAYKFYFEGLAISRTAWKTGTSIRHIEGQELNLSDEDTEANDWFVVYDFKVKEDGDNDDQGEDEQ